MPGSNPWDLCLEGLESESDYPWDPPASASEVSYPYSFRRATFQYMTERSYSTDDPSELALRFFFSQSETLHFIAEMQYSKEHGSKASRLNNDAKEEDEEEKDMFSEAEDEAMENSESLQILKLDPQGLKSHIQNLPPHWRILQINAHVSRSSYFSSEPRSEVGADENPRLYISRASSSEPLDVLCVPSSPHSQEAGPNILQELCKLTHLHASLYKASSKTYSRKEFTDLKRDVDERMASLIRTMESDWLRFGSAWFLGKPMDKRRIDLLESTAKKILGPKSDLRKRARLGYLLDAAHYLSDSYLLLGLHEMNLGESYPLVCKFRDDHPLKSPIKRHPLILILDSQIQQLPWDSLPILSTHPVSRVPSLKFLLIIYMKHKSSKNSVLKSKELSNEIYYILNPDQNLGRTQERLESFFKEELHLEGSTGEHPSLEELERALNSKDGFMYCGHGSTLKNLPHQKLESLNVRAMPLLLGCKSGMLERMGRMYDPMGTAYSYMIATAPAMLGFLWSITDKDVDEWTASFLRFWFEKENRSMGLVEAVAAKKSEFSRIINGASTVVYGLPPIG